MKLPLLFLLLSVSVVVTAQTPSPQSEADSLRLRDIEEIDVYGTARPSRVSLLALPSLTIGGDELSAPSLFTPADALRREAGIALTRDGIWATSVSIRGLSKERILILSDGERVQTATDIAAALSTIDLNSLERIEVIKGAGSVLYGTGAMGGVVNFVSARPAYTGRMTTSGRVGGGFASANRLWTANAGVQVTDRNWYVGVNGSYRQAQDMRTPAGVIDNSQFEDWSVGVQAGLTYADTQELLLDYQHYEANNVGLPGGASFPAQARVRYRNVQRNLLSGEYVFHEPGVYLRELRVKAYTQNFIRDVENYVEPKKTTILPSSTNVTSGARVLTDWTLPSDRHRLKAGAEGWLRDAETGKLVMDLEKADISALLAAGWKAPEVFHAPGRDGKTEMWGIIQRPSNFDPDKKYPIIEYIYSGPGDAYTPKSFLPYNGYTTALAELGFIVVQLDAMGTSYRGKKFEEICYKNLKDAGFPDRIQWIKAAAEKYPCMDTTRVGIYGCSAGGQESMAAVLFHPEFYKAAYSSCGCHDNRMDKIWWNEQWMGYPVDSSYVECSNVENAWRLTRPLMLVVGEMDDNVDPASTLQVANALIKAGKDFELVVLPGAAHTMGESFGEHKRFDFFVEELMGVRPPKWEDLKK